MIRKGDIYENKHNGVRAIILAFDPVMNTGRALIKGEEELIDWLMFRQHWKLVTPEWPMPIEEGSEWVSKLDPREPRKILTVLGVSKRLDRPEQRR
jgi:hypothetical protein